jgi:hypothetical protein
VGEADAIPVELTTPLAVADKLLDPATAPLVAPAGTDNKDTEVASIVSGDSEDTAASVRTPFTTFTFAYGRR